MDPVFSLLSRIEETAEREIDWAAPRQPLSPEARKILETNNVIGIRQLMALHQNGLPLPPAEPITKLAKRASAGRSEVLANGWVQEFDERGDLVRGYAPGVDPEVAFAR